MSTTISVISRLVCFWTEAYKLSLKLKRCSDPHATPTEIGLQYTHTFYVPLGSFNLSLKEFLAAKTNVFLLSVATVWQVNTEEQV